MSCPPGHSLVAVVPGLECSAGHLGPGLHLAGQDVTTGQSGTCELPEATPQVTLPVSGALGVATVQGLGQTESHGHQFSGLFSRESVPLPWANSCQPHSSFSLSRSMSQNQAPNCSSGSSLYFWAASCSSMLSSKTLFSWSQREGQDASQAWVGCWRVFVMGEEWGRGLVLGLCKHGNPNSYARISSPQFLAGPTCAQRWASTAPPPRSCP